MAEALELSIEIVQDLDPEGLDRASRSLRRDLNEIDSVTARPTEQPGGAGAKGDIGLLGTISVTMISAAVPAVIALISRWVNERNRCVVRIARPDGTSLEIQHTLARDEVERIVASLLPG
jgi:hypothetical protein